MSITKLSKNAKKKYPQYDLSDLEKVENYIIEHVQKYNNMTIIYSDIEKKLGYPIGWLQLIFIYEGFNGITLSEKDFLERGGIKKW